jgi:hypothetical protein
MKISKLLDADAVSRRHFIQGAAMAGASVLAPVAAASTAKDGDGRTIDVSKGEGTSRGSALNPIVQNFKGGYGDAKLEDFQAPKRPMGRTGLEVSILGVGGFHLGTVAGQAEVNEMVAMALDHGINFFDNAWEYHKGMSEERVGTALKGKRDKAIVMTKVCTHGRKKDIAMRMLEESLTRLQTDHLDVWQVHEVVYYDDPE